MYTWSKEYKFIFIVYYKQGKAPHNSPHFFIDIELNE